MKGTIQNRESFLKNISKRLNRQDVPGGVERPSYKHKPQLEVLKGATRDELVHVLKEQCKKIHTDVVVTNKEKIVEDMKNIIENYGSGSIVTWKDERFADYGLTPLFSSLDVHE